MENFFNENCANLVQYISLPLEAIGLILTFIEVVRPEFARKIEFQIDNWANIKINRSRIEKAFDLEKFLFESDFFKRVDYFFRICIGIALLVLPYTVFHPLEKGKEDDFQLVFFFTNWRLYLSSLYCRFYLYFSSFTFLYSNHTRANFFHRIIHNCIWFSYFN